MATEQIKPIYVLFGDDEYLRDEHRRQIVALVVGEADPQVCVSNFDDQAELAVVLDELRTLPFLAPRRLVVISPADAFVSAHRESIEKYLQSPSDSGTLMLVVSSWPSTTRLAKLVAKVGQAIDCSVPEKQNLSAWISITAEKGGKKIDASAAAMLGLWVGRDLAMLSTEIEKLSLYALDRPSITEKDVAELVEAAAGPGSFELTNCITAADAPGALRALGGMMNRRGEEFKVLGSLRWHLNRALTAAQAIKKGVPADQAVPYMPFLQKAAFEAMLRRRGIGKLLGDFRRLARADIAMKSGTEAQSAMQDLVMGLCR